MRKTTNLDASRCELASPRRLGAAFPLAAAAEPAARRGNARRIAVENRGDRQRQGPRPGQTVKPNRPEKCRGHQSDGGVYQDPSFARISEKENPGRKKSCEQTGEGKEEKYK